MADARWEPNERLAAQASTSLALTSCASLDEQRRVSPVFLPHRIQTRWKVDLSSARVITPDIGAAVSRKVCVTSRKMPGFRIREERVQPSGGRNTPLSARICFFFMAHQGKINARLCRSSTGCLCRLMPNVRPGGAVTFGNVTCILHCGPPGSWGRRACRHWLEERSVFAIGTVRRLGPNSNGFGGGELAETVARRRPVTLNEL